MYFHCLHNYLQQTFPSPHRYIMYLLQAMWHFYMFFFWLHTGNSRISGCLYVHISIYPILLNTMSQDQFYFDIMMFCKNNCGHFTHNNLGTEGQTMTIFLIFWNNTDLETQILDVHLELVASSCSARVSYIGKSCEYIPEFDCFLFLS